MKVFLDNNSPLTAAFLGSVLSGGDFKKLLPIMDCQNCLYRQEEWRNGGHCYMFREQPAGDRCGQFKESTP